jgi:lycopene cyclase domain-containing protein
MSKYMALLIFSGSIPFLFSLWPALRFYRNYRALLSSISCVLVIFGSWDIFATWRGHWYFDPAGIYGIKAVNLPLEEWLFFIVIPFCCLFTWEVLKYIKAKIK